MVARAIGLRKPFSALIIGTIRVLYPPTFFCLLTELPEKDDEDYCDDDDDDDDEDDDDDDDDDNDEEDDDDDEEDDDDEKKERDFVIEEMKKNEETEKRRRLSWWFVRREYTFMQKYTTMISMIYDDYSRLLSIRRHKARSIRKRKKWDTIKATRGFSPQTRSACCRGRG
ncbi:hypothetical protein V1477_018404 [Vespula maculifrons]|uniref:Uncharacterized protein n=1 Tax=Vespula maculifrons TaxID=7453 RepID=A0ABD2AWJ7_VESMC